MKFILFFVKIHLLSLLSIMFLTQKTYSSSFSQNIKSNSNYHTTNVDTEQQNIKKLNQISEAHGQCLIQLQQQLSENQQDLDILRGHIQEIQHHISKILQNQKKSCQKLDKILNKDNDPNHNNTSDLFNKYINNNKNHNKINEITKNNVDTDYKKAVALVLEKKQYDQAILAFHNFIKNHPKSEYQANAHYWLGQLYYNKGNKYDASYHFALVAKNYPKSSKASEALLKIGIIMQETSQKDKAKTVYKQVGKLYPNSNAAKQAQKRLKNI